MSFLARDWWYYPFPFKDCLEPLDSFKGEFLYLGVLLGKDFDFGSVSKKRLDFGQ